MGMIKVLAELAVNTRTEDISDSAYDAAKKILLDIIGITIAGYNAPGIPQVIAQMREWGGSPEATLFIFGEQLPTPNVAFANSAMAHALDYDEPHQMGVSHVGVSVVPVSLAIGEMVGASGREVLASIILGYEVACRLGVAFRSKNPKGKYPADGFLPAGIIGGFGATAAACRLLGMSIEQTLNAFGINYAQASGNRQALFEKTLTKRIQPAFTARSAIWATFLAKRGITGPHEILEGKAGLFAIYRNADVCNVEELITPRDFYAIEYSPIKPYPCCCIGDAAVAIELGQKYKFRAEDIKLIQVHGQPNSGLTRYPFKFGMSPQATVQFSTPYCVALGVLHGKMGPADITDEKILKDKEVAELASRVVFAPIEEILQEEKKPYEAPEWLPNAGRYHGIKVQLKDGRVFTCFRRWYDIIAPEKTFTWKNVIRKFFQCTDFSGICTSQKAESIILSVKKLEENPDIKSFINENLIFFN